MTKRYVETTYRSVRRLMIMLVFAALSACSLISTLLDKPVPFKADTFEYVCYQIEAMYDVGCGELAAPVVVFSSIIDAASFPYQWYGVYFHGEGYVFVNPSNDEDIQLQVILHETTHYVLYELELIVDNETCEHERVARTISEGVWDQEQKDMYDC